MGTTSVDYYLSLISPWSYLGHERLYALAHQHQLTVNIRPVDFRFIIFPATGGLPAPERPPSRQAYRLQELGRWPGYLGIPLNIHPKHWPTDETLGAQMVVTLRQRGESRAAGDLAHALMRAVWTEDRDISDEDTLRSVAGDLGLHPELLEQARNPEYAALREREAHEAVGRGVFGAPSYVVGEHLFWGQDRLELLAHLLNSD